MKNLYINTNVKMYAKNLVVIYSCIVASHLNAGNESAKNYNLSSQEGMSEFFADGKPMINARLRYESSDAGGMGESKALTFRTRLGYQTPSYSGFQALAEFEHSKLLSDHDDVNLAGTTGQPGLTAIADPETTELNRAWLSYTNAKNVIKIGRERIILNDSRFVGNVGWRQNEQTFDTALLKSNYFDNFAFTYAYVWHVNRIFGEESPLGTAQDFEGDVHLFDATYSFNDWFELTGFAYLIELDGATTGTALGGPSRDTFGIRASGQYTFTENPKNKFSYWASYAKQIDNSNTGTSVDLNYYALDGKFHFDSFYIGAGMEILEGNGTTMFTTPLATVHKFQGFADVFLGASIGGGFGGGITDYYIDVGYTLPLGKGLSLKGWYHWFETDTTSATGFDNDYGSELDLVAVYPINKHFSVLGKYANYQTNGGVANPTADSQIYSIEINFNY